jgi:transcription elongation factor Elf1
MNAEASTDVARVDARRLAFPTCPRCNDEFIAATASEHVSEKQVRHLWSCDSCGHAFVTSVRLPVGARIVNA